MAEPIKLIQSLDDVATLKADWIRLFNQMTDPSPFLSWSWTHSWLKHFGQSTKPFILAFPKPGGLAGILPFRLHPHGSILGLKLPRLEFLVSCPETCADSLGFVGLTEDLHLKQADLIPFFKTQSAFNFTDLKELTSQDDQQSFFKNLFNQAQMKTFVSAYGILPIIDLPESWEAYLKPFKQKKRYNIKAQIKNFENKMTVTTDILTDPQTILDRFSTLIDLCEARWGKVGSSFCSPKSQNLQRDFLESLGTKQESLSPLLLLTRKDDQALGALYGYCGKKSFYFYQTGRLMDPQWRGMGQYLVSKAIQTCIEKGYKTFNFLRGDEGYKHFWTHTQRLDYRLLASRNHPLALATWTGLKLQRQVKNHLKPLLLL